MEEQAMKRWIYAYRYVAGDPERLEDVLLSRADELILDATTGAEPEPAADGSFTVDLTTPLAGIDVAKRIRVQIGVAYRTASRTMLPLQWHADPGRRAFPQFEGTLEIEPLDSRTAQLTLAGSYRLPLGPVGAAVDATVLHGAAKRTAEHLVRALAGGLTKEAAAGPRAAPSPGPRRGEALRVADVMTDEPLTLDDSLPLRTAALLLFHAEVSGAPVVARSGKLVGVLSERDLLAKEATARFGFGRKAAEEDRRRLARTAGDACTRPARTTAPDSLLADVAREMLDADVSRLVVVDEGRVTGIVSRHDVLAALLRDDTEIDYALQRVLDTEHATEVQATVTWGEVKLAGSTRLRTTAEKLPRLAGEIEGVMDVDAEELSWEENDVIPPLPYV
jgi:CBS domain-containing protein